MIDSFVLIAATTHALPNAISLVSSPIIAAIAKAFALAALGQASVAIFKRLSKPSLRHIVLSILSPGWTRRFRGSRYWAQPMGDLEEILGDLREQVNQGKYERFEDLAFLLIQVVQAILGSWLVRAWAWRKHLLSKRR